MDTSSFEPVISSFYTRISGTDGNTAAVIPPDGTWSLKQIVGHLIDSAGNFHQRLVRLQEGNLENFPTYNGGFWVNAQGWQEADWENMRQLWHSFNIHILHVIRNIPDESLANEWFLEEDLGADLEWLINDYYQHMQHHIEKYKGKC